MKFLVCVVDHHLLEAILLEHLKSINIQQSNADILQPLLILWSDVLIQFEYQPVEQSIIHLFGE